MNDKTISYSLIWNNTMNLFYWFMGKHFFYIPTKLQQNNVDIFSMLSKAQNDFNQTPKKPESVPPAFSSSTPRAPDISSQSVMDFFAKAGTKTVTQKPVPTGENVLHRLMSNPAHSVEQIEKQQRSVTPQEMVSYKSEPFGVGDRRSVPISFASSSCPVRRFESFEVVCSRFIGVGFITELVDFRINLMV